MKTKILLIMMIVVLIGGFFIDNYYINQMGGENMQGKRQYQGPVPDGYDLDHFRETGMTRPKRIDAPDKEVITRYYDED